MSGIEQENRSFWSRGDRAAEYDNRVLRPVEVVLLVRHRELLGGRVLEIGCGAGRLTGYLADIAAELHATDISPAMIEHCARNVPAASCHQADLASIGTLGLGTFSAIVAPFNVIDVLDDEARNRVLDELRETLEPGGVLLFSTHNRGIEPSLQPPWVLPRHGRRELVEAVAALPRATRNHLRLRRHEHRGADHVIRNDMAHGYSILHYYIDRDAQERQLERHGFELLECRDLEGRIVEPGGQAADSSELHYLARAPGAGR